MFNAPYFVAPYRVVPHHGFLHLSRTGYSLCGGGYRRLLHAKQLGFEVAACVSRQAASLHTTRTDASRTLWRVTMTPHQWKDRRGAEIAPGRIVSGWLRVASILDILWACVRPLMAFFSCRTGPGEFQRKSRTS